MKEIVKHLSESRLIRSAKDLLESEGYVVKERKVDDSRETSDQDYEVYKASEHKEGERGVYYTYITIKHPSLGTFMASYRVGHDSDHRIRTDGSPWTFLRSKNMRLTPEQIKFIKDNEDEIESKIR